MNKIFTRTLSALVLMQISLRALAVDYELPDMNGQIQHMDQYKGKWVVVNYWATWCSSCMKEIPDLVDFYEHNKDSDATVVGINYESIDKVDLKEIVSGLAIPYPVLRSHPIPVTPLGPVPALPATYIIDPEGNVVAGEVGIVTRKHLEHYISQKKTKLNEVIEISGQ